MAASLLREGVISVASFCAFLNIGSMSFILDIILLYGRLIGLKADLVRCVVAFSLSLPR